MKKMISLILMIVFVSSISFAQKVMPDKVPANVKQAFTKEFPKAMEPGWKLDNNIYQVMFTLNGIKHAAKFEKSGQWIDKEERISMADLPKEVSLSISKNFTGFHAYEAEKVETPAKGTLYNVGLEKGKEFMEVHFSFDGAILDKVSKKMKSEWGKDND